MVLPEPHNRFHELVQEKVNMCSIVERGIVVDREMPSKHEIIREERTAWIENMD